jgi:hypothetical protein
VGFERGAVFVVMQTVYQIEMNWDSHWKRFVVEAVERVWNTVAWLLDMRRFPAAEP